MYISSGTFMAVNLSKLNMYFAFEINVNNGCDFDSGLQAQQDQCHNIDDGCWPGISQTDGRATEPRGQNKSHRFQWLVGMVDLMVDFEKYYYKFTFAVFMHF